jgi:hypothetical protein
MKKLIVALVATFAVGSAFAQQPSALVRSKGGVQVQVVSGSAQVSGKTIQADSSFGAGAGDIVTVTDGAAKVTYSNGCAVTVTAKAPYTIKATDPVCTGEGAVASTDTKYYLMGGGAAALLLLGASGGGGGDDKPSSP